jgi:hypothetical protein
MGVDIYLESRMKPFNEELARTRPPPPQSDSSEEFLAFVDTFFDNMRASGGYFQNAYNSGDVMWAMGLSWEGTVSPMLDERDYLPIERARALVAMIEARPLTRKQVAAHMFENMTAGVQQHPISGPLIRLHEKFLAAEVGEETPPKLKPPDFDHLFSFLNQRRDELLTILRKSIELNEPLLCSL